MAFRELYLVDEEERVNYCLEVFDFERSEVEGCLDWCRARLDRFQDRKAGQILGAQNRRREQIERQWAMEPIC